MCWALLPWQGRLIEPQDEGGVRVIQGRGQLSVLEGADGRTAHHAEYDIADRRPRSAGAGCHAPVFFGMVVGDSFDLAYPTCTPPNPRREVFSFR